MKIKQYDKKTIKSLFSLLLSVIICASVFTIDVQAADLVQSSSEQLIPINSNTDISKLQGVEKNTDLYNDILEIQKENQDNFNIIPNMVQTKAMAKDKNTLRVQVQNIGIDTLDRVIVSVKMYKNGSVNIATSRNEYNILPLFWRNNDFYCAGYNQALITISAYDGSASSSSTFVSNN